MKLLLKYMLLGGLLCISFGSNAQDLDIEAMTKDTKFKVSGGINADAMFFNSSTEKTEIWNPIQTSRVKTIKSASSSGYSVFIDSSLTPS